MEQTTVPCVIMRGGTSKGLYFVDVNTPDADFDRTRERVLAKFVAVAAPILGNKRAEAVIAATASLPQTDVRQLLDLCIPSP